MIVLKLSIFGHVLTFLHLFTNALENNRTEKSWKGVTNNAHGWHYDFRNNANGAASYPVLSDYFLESGVIPYAVNVPRRTYLPPVELPDYTGGYPYPPAGRPTSATPASTSTTVQRPANDPVPGYLPPSMYSTTEFTLPEVIDARRPTSTTTNSRARDSKRTFDNANRNGWNVATGVYRDEHSSESVKIIEMKCDNGVEGRFRAIFQPSELGRALQIPVFEDVRGGQLTTGECTVLKDGTRMKLDVSSSSYAACGVIECSDDGRTSFLCVRLRFPTMEGLRLADDFVLTLRCRIQEPIVIHTKRVEMPVSGGVVCDLHKSTFRLLRHMLHREPLFDVWYSGHQTSAPGITVVSDEACDIAGEASTYVNHNMSARSAGTIAVGGASNAVRCQLEVMRRGPGEQFSTRLEPGATVSLGEELSVRVIVADGDGWQWSRLGEVWLEGGGVAGEGDGARVTLLTSDGCLVPEASAICPQLPRRESTLAHALLIRAPMFEGSASGSTVQLSVRVMACRRAQDCASRCARKKRFLDNQHTGKNITEATTVSETSYDVKDGNDEVESTVKEIETREIIMETKELKEIKPSKVDEVLFKNGAKDANQVRRKRGYKPETMISDSVASVAFTVEIPKTHKVDFSGKIKSKNDKPIAGIMALAGLISVLMLAVLLAHIYRKRMQKNDELGVCKNDIL